MEFRKAMFGYPREQVRSLIAGLEEEQGREEQQLAERISAAEAEIKEMEERLAELEKLREERENKRPIITDTKQEIALWNIWVYYQKDIMRRLAQQKNAGGGASDDD